MRAALYTRISLDRAGQQLGVQRQRDDCRALADQLGWQVTAEYDDNDRSATSGKPRPGFEALLDAMKNGDVDAVIAWHPDRLYRKLSDLSRLLDVAKGVEFRTVTAGELDLSTPTGRMVASIMGSVATAEVEHKSERQRRAAQQLAERGVPKWRKAFGYVDAGGDRRELDPVTAPLVKQAYADIIAGASLNDVCQTWNRAGATTLTGKPWTAPQLSTFLRKPRNAGLRTYQADRGPADRDSIIGPGAWPAIVDEETFWAAQRVLEADGRKPGRKTVRQHLLTGMLTCGKCGGSMSAAWAMVATGNKPGRPKAGEVKPPKKREHRIIYGCKGCHGISIRAEQVEPIIYALVAGRLAQADAVGLLRAEHDTAEAEQIRRELATLRGELDAIGEERADGLLTGRQAQIATRRIQARIDALEVRAHDAERVRVFDGIPLGTADVEDAVLKLSPDRFRTIMDVLMRVTIAATGKTGNMFRPERVQVEWR